MSIFVIGAWYWASVVMVGVAAALVAAFATWAITHVRPLVGSHVAALRNHVDRASVGLQEPLPSSPSHPSFRRPL